MSQTRRRDRVLLHPWHLSFEVFHKQHGVLQHCAAAWPGGDPPCSGLQPLQETVIPPGCAKRNSALPKQCKESVKGTSEFDVIVTNRSDVSVTMLLFAAQSPRHGRKETLKEAMTMLSGRRVGLVEAKVLSLSLSSRTVNIRGAKREVRNCCIYSGTVQMTLQLWGGSSASCSADPWLNSITGPIHVLEIRATMKCSLCSSRQDTFIPTNKFHHCQRCRMMQKTASYKRLLSVTIKIYEHDEEYTLSIANSALSSYLERYDLHCLENSEELEHFFQNIVHSAGLSSAEPDHSGPTVRPSTSAGDHRDPTAPSSGAEAEHSAREAVNTLSSQSSVPRSTLRQAVYQHHCSKWSSGDKHAAFIAPLSAFAQMADMENLQTTDTDEPQGPHLKHNICQEILKANKWYTENKVNFKGEVAPPPLLYMTSDGANEALHKFDFLPEILSEDEKADILPQREVRNCCISSGTVQMMLQLWGRQVDAVQVWSSYAFTELLTKTFEGKIQLTTSASTTCSPIGDLDVADRAGGSAGPRLNSVTGPIHVLEIRATMNCSHCSSRQDTFAPSNKFHRCQTASYKRPLSSTIKVYEHDEEYTLSIASSPPSSYLERYDLHCMENVEELEEHFLGLSPFCLTTKSASPTLFTLPVRAAPKQTTLGPQSVQAPHKGPHSAL
ncbi:hypothetical protein SRHO_G00235760 [Serrasalmus rhombeus]